MITLEIPGLPTMINKSKSFHWAKRAKETKQWKQLVFFHLQSKGLIPPAPYQKAEVTLTRCSAAVGDMDNIAASFKAVLDGLTEAGVIEDDSPKHVELSYGWEKAKALAGHIRIQVKDLTQIIVPQGDSSQRPTLADLPKGTILFNGDVVS
jgi:Holliday junction resolvase RusA-like endonuclease